MSRKLTAKQRIFVREYAKTGNGKRSAAIAHNLPIDIDKKADNVAANMASEHLTRPNVISALDALMNDEELLAKVHREGLKASTWLSKAVGQGKSELVKKPDYHARHKYLDTAMKIKRKYQDMNIGQALIVNIGGVTAAKYQIETPNSRLEGSTTQANKKDDTSIK